MRTRPLFFALWFPVTVACIMPVIAFLRVLADMPESTGGMADLGKLPFYSVLWGLSPFVIGLILCLLLRPRRSALRRGIVIPTVLLTASAAAALAIIPDKKEPTYQVVCEFVDPQGQPLPELSVSYTLEIPQYLHGKSYQRPAPQTAVVRDGRLTITKKRMEQLELKAEAPGFYYVDVNLGQWLGDSPDYIHKTDFFWRRDLTVQTRADSMSGSINWRPVRDRVLRVVMYRDSDAPQLPFPEYTEKDYQEAAYQDTAGSAGRGGH